MNSRWWSKGVYYFLVFLLQCSFVFSSRPALYCKCVLGTKSTIITLKEKFSCSDCTPTLCLEDPTFGKNTEGQTETMTTTCFQRDSIKDQLMIYTFLIITGVLLIGVFVKPRFQSSRRN